MPAVWTKLSRFVPAMPPVSRAEQIRGCVGALLGLAAVGLMSALLGSETHGLSALIPPMGASAVLLFALPASPLAQPWSILGGNLISAAIGVGCARWIPDATMAASLAASAAIGAMFLLRCLHPPSGAIALTAVLGGDTITDAGFGFVLWPVVPASLTLLLAAVAYNRLSGRTYPHVAATPAPNPHRTADAAPTHRLGVRTEDLDAVLSRHDELLDVDRSDLSALFLEAEMEAHGRRHQAITCRHIMSKDVATVAPDALLRDAWALLRRHRIKALPVVAPDRTLVGILTQTDFMRCSDWDPRHGLRTGLRRLAQTVVRLERDPITRVREIMTADVTTATPDTPVARLVPAMADRGLHHVPVVDADGRIAGIVTQSDLVAALFKVSLADPAAGAGPVRPAASPRRPTA
ncbi:HPP family protein [Chthonobacter rhizosphaerae]|uniref:HPP family protein n=1 Tax=Chthonobacter rhizosphaerae TaxID=2735553 RepID=UPI0015EF7AB4|nr:HPP family protein [Chthonobacter rhizosphaerae]